MSSQPTFLPEAKKRPQFRNINVLRDIPHYRLPATGKVSILHRISGAGLFLFMPFLLWLFDLSLMSELSFARLRELGGHWFVKLILVGLIWAFLHHFIAGIRYLLLDLDIGTEKVAARRGAYVVFALSLPLTLLAALKVFGVF